jgi:hypothetical protein
MSAACVSTSRPAQSARMHPRADPRPCSAAAECRSRGSARARARVRGQELRAHAALAPTSHVERPACGAQQGAGRARAPGGTPPRRPSHARQAPHTSARRRGGAGKWCLLAQQEGALTSLGQVRELACTARRRALSLPVSICGPTARPRRACFRLPARATSLIVWQRADAAGARSPSCVWFVQRPPPPAALCLLSFVVGGLSFPAAAGRCGPLSQAPRQQQSSERIAQPSVRDMPTALHIAPHAWGMAATERCGAGSRRGVARVNTCGRWECSCCHRRAVQLCATL